MQVDHIEIAKLELHPGDLLVVQVPPDWTHEQQINAHNAVKEAMRQAGANVPIIIGGTDVEFSIVSRLTT